MAAIDQPLKKRKLCDSSPIVPLSQDEILRRRRNREEIRNLYDSYRRIKFCVSQKDARLMPDLEQSYLSLITASRGCTSVQRIVAELIPRYASFCPTALEAAVKVSINMYTWSVAIIIRREDVDSVAYQTAKACIFGLVDICCSASREAPTSSVISGICSAVFQNVLTFFTSTFEGKDIYHIGHREIQKLQEPVESFCELKQELEDDNEPPLQKLFKFRALSLLYIFFSFPKNLLAACFELLVTGGSDTMHHDGVRYLLKQLTRHLIANELIHSSNKISDGIPLCADSAQCDTVCKGSEERNPVSNDNNGLEKPLLLPSDCFIGMVLHGRPSLRGWMLWRYKKLCESFSSERISDLSSFLEKIFGSLSDAVMEAGSEESTEESLDPLECTGAPYTSYQVTTQHSDNADASSMTRSLGVHNTSITGTFLKDFGAAKADAGQNLKPHNSLLSKLSNKIDTHSGVGGLAHEGGRSASMKNLEIGNLEDSFANKPSPKDMTNSQIIHPDIRRHSDLRNDPYMRSHPIEVEKIQASSIDIGLLAMTSPSSCAPHIFPSPRQYSTAQRHASYNQNFWYSDGDLAALDVFAASNQLWLGSIGHDASEMSVRAQFEDFGPLTQFIFVPAKEFALIEYRNILDAVRAREYMQGSSPWGGFLRIKFLDRGLGSRGVVSNIAVGDSCHVYIGKVSTQKEKDDILHELIRLGMTKPQITDLAVENALLLEFRSAEEATTAISHVRYLRRENGCRTYPDTFTLNTSSNDMSVSSCQLLVRQIDASVSEEELINAFSMHGELTRWQFNRSACYCCIDFRSPEAAHLAKSNLHGARFGATSILVEFRVDNSRTFANHMAFSSPGPSLHDSSVGISTPRNMNASGNFQCHGDLYPTGTEIKPPNPCSGSFTYKPDGNIHDLVSPRLKLENTATHAHSAHPFQTSWPTTSSSEMLEVGSRNFDDFGRSSDHSLAGPVTPREQVWHYKNQEIEPLMFSHATQPYPPTGVPGGSMMPPSIQDPSFVRPVYFNPSNSWDNSAQNSSISNQIPTGMMQTDNHHFNTRPVVPFIPSSVTPVSQLPGGSKQRYDQMASVPSLPSPIPPPPPPPDVPPPPSSPPPLPPSLPPSVPPPPSSPPPQSGTGSSSLLLEEPHMRYQWQGTLSKSGVHYCMIYATREDSAACKYSIAASEPVDWPVILDVTKRTDLRHVKTTFASTRLHRREVCRLLPSTANDHKGLQDFTSYLKQRECAGVIKISAGRSLWARLLFILPYSHDTCSLLGISPHPADCLIALVLPKDTSSEAA